MSFPPPTGVHVVCSSVEGRLVDAPGSGAERVIIENTLFLEEGKPATLGITNLHEGLILVLRRRAK